METHGPLDVLVQLGRAIDGRAPTFLSWDDDSGKAFNGRVRVQVAPGDFGEEAAPDGFVVGVSSISGLSDAYAVGLERSSDLPPPSSDVVIDGAPVGPDLAVNTVTNP